MCADQNAMEWIEAWLNKKSPRRTNLALCTCYPGALMRVILILMHRNLRQLTIGLRPAPML
jgi:hypothetical protein